MIKSTESQTSKDLRALYAEDPLCTTFLLLLPLHTLLKPEFAPGLINPLIAGYFSSQFGIGSEWSNISDGTLQGAYYIAAGCVGFYTTYLTQRYSTYETIQFTNVLYVVLCLLFSILWIDGVAQTLTYWPSLILMTIVYVGIGSCDAVGLVKINAALLKIRDRYESLYLTTQAIAYAGFSLGPAIAVYMSTAIYTYSGGKAWVVWLALAGISMIEVVLTEYLPAVAFKRPNDEDLQKKVPLPTLSRTASLFPTKYWLAASIVCGTFTMYGLYQVAYFLFAEGTASRLHERGWDAIFSAQVYSLTMLVEVSGFLLFSFYAKDYYFGLFGMSGGLAAAALLFCLYCFFLGSLILSDAPTGWIVTGFLSIIIFAAQASTVEMLMAMVSDTGDEDDAGALERKGQEAVEAFFAIFNFELHGSVFIGSVYSGLLYNYLGYGGLLLLLGALLLVLVAYFYVTYGAKGTGGHVRRGVTDKHSADGGGDGGGAGGGDSVCGSSASAAATGSNQFADGGGEADEMTALMGSA